MYSRTIERYKRFFGDYPPERYWGEGRHAGGSRANENPLEDTPQEAKERAIRRAKEIERASEIYNEERKRELSRIQMEMEAAARFHEAIEEDRQKRWQESN